MHLCTAGTICALYTYCCTWCYLQRFVCWIASVLWTDYIMCYTYVCFFLIVFSIFPFNYFILLRIVVLCTLYIIYFTIYHGVSATSRSVTRCRTSLVAGTRSKTRCLRLFSVEMRTERHNILSHVHDALWRVYTGWSLWQGQTLISLTVSECLCWNKLFLSWTRYSWRKIDIF